ncbi:MAG: DUF4410 domain-containing protein [Nitrospirota bacterium]|nr:DUF4410 domain-containing protein [Nitrospirota bacterium]
MSATKRASPRSSFTGNLYRASAFPLQEQVGGNHQFWRSAQCSVPMPGGGVCSAASHLSGRKYSTLGLRRLQRALPKGACAPLERMAWPRRLAHRKGAMLAWQRTEVNEGSRMQRAIIGFGKGETGMEVQVSVSDLAGNPDAPFVIVGTVKEPGHMPGAVVALNPFVAATKFAIQMNVSERDVEQTAKEIVQEMLKYRDKFKSETGAPGPA